MGFSAPWFIPPPVPKTSILFKHPSYLRDIHQWKAFQPLNVLHIWGGIWLNPKISLSLLCLYCSVQFSSVTQSCPTLWDPMNHSMPGLPVHHQLPEFTQTHVHRDSDAIQPSHPLSSPYMQMTPPLWQKVKRNWKASWWKWKRRVWMNLVLGQWGATLSSSINTVMEAGDSSCQM